MRRLQLALIWSLGGLVGFYLCIGGFAALGWMVNTTPSYPYGIYVPLHRAFRTGDLVSFCPSRSIARLGLKRAYLGPGPCPSGSEPMLKRLVAASGDRYLIGPAGVEVGERRVANSTPLTRDGQGRLMPRLALGGVLSPGSLLVMSDYSPVSFDARYFGPIARSEIIRGVRPLMTF
jgi:conjugative transfer signal peptidase TraF